MRERRFEFDSNKYLEIFIFRNKELSVDQLERNVSENLCVILRIEISNPSTKKQKFSGTIKINAHHIKGDFNISEKDMIILSDILKSMPLATCTGEWKDKFLSEKFENTYPRNLLNIASNAYDEYGNTMLGVATEYGSVESMQRLISFGANLNTPDGYNRKPLYWAITSKPAYRDPHSKEALGILKLLINKGSNVFEKSIYNRTYFFYAKKQNFTAAAGILLNVEIQKLRSELILYLYDIILNMIFDYLPRYSSQGKNSKFRLFNNADNHFKLNEQSLISVAASIK